MKKALSRILVLAGLLALAVVPGCTAYDDSDYYDANGVGVSVSVYGGYYPAGWAACCSYAPIGVPRGLPAHY